jgi:hypothetical protein
VLWDGSWEGASRSLLSNDGSPWAYAGSSSGRLCSSLCSPLVIGASLRYHNHRGGSSSSRRCRCRSHISPIIWQACSLRSSERGNAVPAKVDFSGDCPGPSPSVRGLGKRGVEGVARQVERALVPADRVALGLPRLAWTLARRRRFAGRVATPGHGYPAVSQKASGPRPRRAVVSAPETPPPTVIRDHARSVSGRKPSSHAR